MSKISIPNPLGIEQMEHLEQYLEDNREVIMEYPRDLWIEFTSNMQSFNYRTKQWRTQKGGFWVMDRLGSIHPKPFATAEEAEALLTKEKEKDLLYLKNHATFKEKRYGMS